MTPTRRAPMQLIARWYGCLLIVALLHVDGVKTASISLGLALRISSSTGQHLGTPGEGVVLAAYMAVDHVNKRVNSLVPDAESLVPAGMNISLDVRDTQGSPVTGTRAALDWDVDVIIGAQRSSVSVAVSYAAALSSKPIISFASTSTALSDKSSYPTFSRVVPSDGILANFMVNLLIFNGWQRYAIIYIDDTYGKSYAQDITAISGAVERLSVATAQGYKSRDSASIEEAVQKLAESGARVFVCIAFEVDLVQILQFSKQYGISGRGYVWVTGDAVVGPEEVVIAAGDSDAAELRQLMTGWLRVVTAPHLGEAGEKFASVLRSEGLEAAVPALPPAARSFIISDVQRSLEECSEKCVYVYDSVWAAAIAVAKTEEEHGGPLSRANTAHQQALLANIRSLDFRGASGRVKLDPATGDRASDGLRLLVLNWAPAGPDASRLVSRPVWLHDGERILRATDAPPVWPGGASNWTPPADGICPPGHIFSATTLACEPCPVGHDLDFRAPVCMPCRVGTIAGEPGTAECTPCQEGYADEIGLEQCKSCPDFSRRAASSPGVSVSECRCIQGFYRASAGSECIECPSGAECPGGVDLPFNRRQYWADKECQELGGDKECEHWDLFSQCNPPGNCLDRFECAEGRTGRLCQEALDGYFRIGSQWWFKCGKYGKVWTAMGIVVVVLLWFAIEVVATNRYVAMSVALIFVQIVGMISTFGLKWHSILYGLNTVLEIANFDVDFVSPFCLVTWSAVSSFYMQLLLPLIMVLLYALFYSCREVVRSTLGWGVVDYTGAKDERTPLERIKENLIQDSVAFVIIVYHTLCIKCFQTFRCGEFPDGISYMVFVPEVECWTWTHIGMVISASIYILLVIIGVPVLVGYKVMKHQRNGTLHDPAVNRVWGFVHEAYEIEYKYWELMLLLRRFLVALLSVVLETSMLQAAITIIVLALLLAAHVFTSPYVSAKIDVLDFCGMCGSIGYVLAGMLLFPSVTQAAQGRLCKENDWHNPWCRDELVIKDSTAVIAMCGIILTVFIACWLTVLFIREVRHARRASQIIFKGFKADAENENQLPPINETANQVNLEMILEGSYLLRWTREWKKKVKEVHSGRASFYRGDEASADDASAASNPSPPASVTGLRATTISPELKSYLVIDGGVRTLEEDVTQFSNSSTARILRHLCEIPGILEFLTHNPTDHSLWSFVTKCAQYCEDLEAQFDRQSAGNKHARTLPEWLVGLKGTPFPVTSLIKFEHRPIIAYWLMKGSEEEREHFHSLMHLIMKSNGAPHLHYSSGHFSRAVSLTTKKDAHPPRDFTDLSRERPQSPADSSEHCRGGSPVSAAATPSPEPGKRQAAVSSNSSPAPRAGGQAREASPEAQADEPAERAIGRPGQKSLPSGAAQRVSVSPNGSRASNGIRLDSDIGMVRRISIELSTQPEQQRDSDGKLAEINPVVSQAGQSVNYFANGHDTDRTVRSFESKQGSSKSYMENKSPLPQASIENRLWGSGAFQELAMPIAGVEATDLDI